MGSNTPELDPFEANVEVPTEGCFRDGGFVDEQCDIKVAGFLQGIGKRADIFFSATVGVPACVVNENGFQLHGRSHSVTQQIQATFPELPDITVKPILNSIPDGLYAQPMPVLECKAKDLPSKEKREVWNSRKLPEERVVLLKHEDSVSHVEVEEEGRVDRDCCRDLVIDRSFRNVGESVARLLDPDVQINVLHVRKELFVQQTRFAKGRRAKQRETAR